MTTTTAASLLATLPAAAFRPMYGEPAVFIEWSDRASVLSDFIAALPTDAAGWEDLSTALKSELYPAGHSNREAARDLETAVGSCTSTGRETLMTLDDDAWPIAFRLRSWLGARAMSQVSSERFEDTLAVAQQSIRTIA